MSVQTVIEHHLISSPRLDFSWDFSWVYGVVVSMFDFHRSNRGSNPGRGGKIS